MQVNNGFFFPRDAFVYVQQKRFCIHPNEGFVQQLHVSHLTILHARCFFKFFMSIHFSLPMDLISMLKYLKQSFFVFSNRYQKYFFLF